MSNPRRLLRMSSSANLILTAGRLFCFWIALPASVTRRFSAPAVWRSWTYVKSTESMAALRYRRDVLGERDRREAQLHRAGAGPLHGAVGSVPGEFSVYVTVRRLNHGLRLAITTEAPRAGGPGWGAAHKNEGRAARRLHALARHC